MKLAAIGFRRIRLRLPGEGHFSVRRFQPILDAAASMRVTSYIKRIFAERRETTMTANTQQKATEPNRTTQGTREDGVTLEDQLREDVRRYESDLRKLAKT